MKWEFALVLWIAMSVFGCAAQEKDSGWDPATDQKISAGQVELGMTKEMVTAALGKPARVRMEEGEEIWEYDDYNRGPTTGFGSGQRDIHYSVHFKADKVVMIKGDPGMRKGPVMTP